ncbi:MAG: potassium-transporting ATPase subunit KdpC [Thermoanaerobaculaceae bacterium]|nr:potassium-transporting ATPase subunit KdpC [Thermoanaerobaculaceae bacterium]TAM48389.1 MAG: potassium-transporting ATPase subunit KdpC [Acidobacteriota bacterium]
MRSQLRPALVLLVALHVLTGLVYPLAVTGVAQVVWPAEAGGSLVAVNGRARGSRLIGQPFSSPGYFWGRPSATSPVPYDASASSGSNLGPTNPALLELVRARIAALRAADPTLKGPIPVDLVTASASGLDPDISVAAALVQIPRVARARGIGEAGVRALVERHAVAPTLGLLGEPRVNVLLLNLALDAGSERGPGEVPRPGV